MSRNSRWANLLLLLLAVGLPLAGTDLLLRALQLPKGSDRVLLLAGSDLSSGAEGYRRYQPRRQIEHSAIYGDQIAYRSRFISNNLGLISSPDIAPGSAIDLAIVGDSFGEGIGGYAWIPNWQRTWLQPQGLVSINYAIGGSGFGDFAVAARAARIQHKARKILVLFIEHDAYRPYQTMASQPGCSYYSNGWLDHLIGPMACRLYGVVWHHVPVDLSDQQRIAAALAHQQYGVITALNRAVAWLARPGQASGPQTRPSDPAGQGTSARRPPMPLRFGPIPQASLKALAAIKALYGPDQTLLVQLPDGPAPGSQDQLRQKDLFRQQLSADSGMNVVPLEKQCPLRASDFHQLDNHPNSRGYARLLGCLSRSPEIQSFLLSQASASTIAVGSAPKKRRP